MAVAYDSAGAITTSAPVTVSVSASGLPEPATYSTDIGRPAIAGHSSYVAGAFTVTAAGADIWDTSDQFHFVYQAVTGDADITARVVSLTNTALWRRPG